LHIALQRPSRLSLLCDHAPPHLSHRHAVVRVQINSAILHGGLLWLEQVRKLTLTPPPPAVGGRPDEFQLRNLITARANDQNIWRLKGTVKADLEPYSAL
jgi:hypothetical protein